MEFKLKKKDIELNSNAQLKYILLNKIFNKQCVLKSRYVYKIK